jgi:insulysin
MRPLLKKLLLPLLAALCLVPGGAALAQPAAPAPTALAVPPRDPAPGDLSQTRRLVLPNGIKLLLLSDPKLNVSSASVAVGVGSLADPPTRQGLAHYLEHMLFLGTRKWPAEDQWRRFLAANGGASNAYTSSSNVNYHFTVRNQSAVNQDIHRLPRQAIKFYHRTLI